MPCSRLFQSVVSMVAVLASASVLAGGLPVLTGIYPAGANVAGGNSVLLTGSNFPPTSFVTFDGAPADIFRLDANNIYMTVPPHAAGTVTMVYYENSRSTRGALTLPFTYSEDHDAGRDFSAVQNPVGVWTYGVAPGFAQTMTVSAATGIENCLDTWSGDNLHPVIGRNRTDATCNMYSWSWPAGKIGIHPDNTPEYGVIRFTAPKASRYHVEGDFVCIDTVVACTVHVAILHNDVTTVFARNISASFVPEAFSFEITLATGDRLDFTQGNGNGTFNYDQMVLDARIHEVSVFADGFEGAP